MATKQTKVFTIKQTKIMKKLSKVYQPVIVDSFGEITNLSPMFFATEELAIGSYTQNLDTLAHQEGNIVEPYALHPWVPTSFNCSFFCVAKITHSAVKQLEDGLKISLRFGYFTHVIYA